LAKFNPQEGHTIRKNLPESDTCVQIYRKMKEVELKSLGKAQIKSGFAVCSVLKVVNYSL